MIKQDYIFRAVTAADLPMLHRWLATPHVRKWWGEPDKELAMIAEDMAGTVVDTLVVRQGLTDFAYVQHYEVHAFGEDHLDHFPVGTRAIDTFIGREDMVGAGHGSAYMRQLALQLLDSGVSGVLIDPNPENLQAIGAYRKAGFCRLERVRTSEGPATLMQFSADR